MNEEELKELQAKLEAQKAEQEKEKAELEKRKGELDQKENELNEKQKRLDDDKADTNKITETLKQGYEEKLSNQKAEYEERLKKRDDIIAQLGHEKEPPKHEKDAFDLLNETRKANRSAF